MDKNVIDTLLSLAAERQIDLLETNEEINEDDNDFSYGRIARNKLIDHLEDAIDQLTKLKEFEFPTDKEIETHYREYLPKEGVEYCIIGAKVMRDNIKFKFQ